MAAACAVLAGCASDGSMQAGSTAARGAVRFSPDYGKLKSVDGVEGSYRYIDTSVRLRRYEKVMIGPVKLMLAPRADAANASPEVMTWIADAVRMEFVGALLSDYQVDAGERWGYQIVDAPGPDVIRVRLAITGIHPVKPNLTATDFIPIRRSSTWRAMPPGMRRVAGPHGRGRGARSCRADGCGSGRDAQSDMTLPQGGDIRWKELKGIAATWAGSFRQQR